MSDITRELLRSRHQIIEGYPNDNEGREGERVYCSIGGRINEYIKHQHSWQLLSSTADAGEENKKVIKTIAKRIALTYSGDNEEFIKKDGSRDFTGDQSHGGNDITNVGDLDVDGATSLDRTAINTTDGAFSVTGANASSITTTGSNDISLTSGQDININPTGELDIDANTVDLDVARGFDADIGELFSLTGSTNMTMEATGSAANTMLVQNTNNHASSFTGINIKTDSGGIAGSFNNIVINCDNVSTKGSDYGVTVRSENGILIEAVDANTALNPTQIKMTANAGIDIGANTALTPTSHTPVVRTVIHDKLEIQELYKQTGSINCSNASIVFDQLDTPKLMRNFTYTAKLEDLADEGELPIISAEDLESTVGTVYLVMVNIDVGSSPIREGSLVATCARLASTTWLVTVLGSSINNIDGVGVISALDVGGLKWTSDVGHEASEVYATAQRIAEASDYP